LPFLKICGRGKTNKHRSGSSAFIEAPSIVVKSSMLGPESQIMETAFTGLNPVGISF